MPIYLSVLTHWPAQPSGLSSETAVGRAGGLSRRAQKNRPIYTLNIPGSARNARNPPPRRPLLDVLLVPSPLLQFLTRVMSFSQKRRLPSRRRWRWRWPRCCRPPRLKREGGRHKSRRDKPLVIRTCRLQRQMEKERGGEGKAREEAYPSLLLYHDS